jgi:hypothetical protein
LQGRKTNALFSVAVLQYCKDEQTNAISNQRYSTARMKKPDCGENSWIFRDAADQTLPVTEFSEIYK